MREGISVGLLVGLEVSGFAVTGGAVAHVGTGVGSQLNVKLGHVVVEEQNLFKQFTPSQEIPVGQHGCVFLSIESGQ
jgi:hypothetical protein